MTDAQIVAVYRCRFGPEVGEPFDETVEVCRGALLAMYPGHATVEAIFESGALSPEWRLDAYAKFGVAP